MIYNFKKAEASNIPEIWDILQNAIIRRKKDGSNQWQDGYPNPEVIKKDIEKGAGYILTEGETIIGYSAILINDEPEYLKIEGNWLTNTDFVVFHRVAIAEKYLGHNLSQKIIECIEDFARKNNIKSLKADTNHDNFAMTKIFEKSGFKRTGSVLIDGNEAYEYEYVLRDFK